MMQLRRILCLALTLSFASFVSAQDNWGRFRGPNGAGVSAATSIPATWSAEDYNWQVELPGAGHASPVVWGERIYCTCGDPETARRTVLCLRTSDGSVMWRRDFESETYRQHASNGFATATPAADAQGVVVTWTTPEEVQLLAFDNSGNTKWHRHLGRFVGPHGSGSSPVIHESVVVLANMQEDTQLLGRLIGRENPDGPIGESFVIAVDRATGKDRWRLPRQTTLASYSTPCVRQRNDGRCELICSSTSDGLSAYDLATGATLWQLPDLFEDRCVGSPILVKELVLASYGHGTRGSLLATVRGSQGSQGSQGNKPAVVHRRTRAVPLVPTPVAVDGLVFLWTDAGVVSCVRCDAGEQLWQERVSGNFYGSPVCAGNRLYCVDKRGTVVVIAASERFELLGRMDLGEASFATPAIAGGVMYLRTKTRLFSIGGDKVSE